MKIEFSIEVVQIGQKEYNLNVDMKIVTPQN